MIRVFLFLYITVSTAHPCMAQSSYYVEDPKVFTGGLILGANFAQVDGDTYYGYHRFGLNAGGVVYVHFTTKVGASLEILYSQKGSRGEAVTVSPVIGAFMASYYMNLNYIEVPLTFHFIYRDVDLEAGASYARLVRSGEWIQADHQVVIDPVLNRFNTTDIEYVFGVSRKIYKNLYANFRFQYSIISIRPNARVPAGFGYGNNGQFNNLLDLRLMYMF